MPLAFDLRARRLLRQFPRATVYSWAELALLFLLAVQCARLFWTLVTPVGPVGDWRPASSFRPALQSSSELLGSFDPFFRTQGSAGPAVVTSLDLQLFGVREDRASGRGSAIIGKPSGEQKSYQVGEEIEPGVTLRAVAFDHVTISRNGVAEQIFMDQTSSAPVVSPPERTTSPSPATGPAQAPGRDEGDVGEGR